MARIDYDRMASRYDRGRGLPPGGIEPWRAALSRYLEPPPVLPVLDLGSGTGEFARAFVGWFGVRVIGVEPAEGMRRQACSKGPAANVVYVGGDAERIPLRDGSCGCAWLSTVIHHIPDLRGCARELRRVLCAAAVVLIRSSFPGRHEHITLFRFFPGAGKIAEKFPSVEETVDAFTAAGFAMEALESVPQVSAPSLRAFAERVRVGRHADSTLAPLGDAEFARGLARLEKAVAGETTPTPVVDRLDLLVLR
jgi:SAM-dependent methyltransferase